MRGGHYTKAWIPGDRDPHWGVILEDGDQTLWSKWTHKERQLVWYKGI